PAIAGRGTKVQRSCAAFLRIADAAVCVDAFEHSQQREAVFKRVHKIALCVADGQVGSAHSRKTVNIPCKILA
ncbi:MAG: hypothetical protein ACKVUS_02450, partial [Saprospiraceae bacterium]